MIRAGLNLADEQLKKVLEQYAGNNKEKYSTISFIRTQAQMPKSLISIVIPGHNPLVQINEVIYTEDDFLFVLELHLLASAAFSTKLFNWYCWI